LNGIDSASRGVNSIRMGQVSRRCESPIYVGRHYGRSSQPGVGIASQSHSLQHPIHSQLLLRQTWPPQEGPNFVIAFAMTYRRSGRPQPIQKWGHGPPVRDRCLSRVVAGKRHPSPFRRPPWAKSARGGNHPPRVGAGTHPGWGFG
jgi:hypothetical protein